MSHLKGTGDSHPQDSDTSHPNGMSHVTTHQNVTKMTTDTVTAHPDDTDTTHLAGTEITHPESIETNHQEGIVMSQGADTDVSHQNQIIDATSEEDVIQRHQETQNRPEVSQSKKGAGVPRLSDDRTVRSGQNPRKQGHVSTVARRVTSKRIVEN